MTLSIGGPGRAHYRMFWRIVVGSPSNQQPQFAHLGQDLPQAGAQVARCPDSLGSHFQRASSLLVACVAGGVFACVGHACSYSALGGTGENLPRPRTPDERLHFAVEFNFAGMAAGADDRYFLVHGGERAGQLQTLQDLFCVRSE